jgi:hypothetical protein
LTILDYQDVVARLGSSRAHLLLGNGFSIACEPCFAYSSLFEYAKQNGLPPTALAVFERLGTNNFEGVMRLLDEGDWLAGHYGLLGGQAAGPMRADLDAVKSALINSLAKTHPDHTHKVDVLKKQACIKFLMPYHNVFTTNYDLLLYWVELEGMNVLGGQDGFRQDIDGFDDDYVVFSERLGDQKGLFFIHGALHLYVESGQVRKHSWNRTAKFLMDNVREGLAAGRYPLFVAEGKAEQKLNQIQGNGYLSYCLGKLERIQKSLVVYGLSFGDSDDHISRVIAHNRDLPNLYVGLYGDPESPANLIVRSNIAKIIERRKALVQANWAKKELTVEYYRSETAPVWK